MGLKTTNNSRTADALAVLVLTERTRQWLLENDPKALAQAVGALLYGVEHYSLSAEAIKILADTDDILLARGIRVEGA
jgi:hypothetical protein